MRSSMPAVRRDPPAINAEPRKRPAAQRSRGQTIIDTLDAGFAPSWGQNSGTREYDVFMPYRHGGRSRALVR